MTIKDNIILKTKLYIFSHVKLAKFDIYIDKLLRSILITYGLRVRAALRNIKPTSQDRGYIFSPTGQTVEVSKSFYSLGHLCPGEYRFRHALAISDRR